MSKKVLFLLITVLAISMLLFGCNQQTQQPGTSDPGTSDPGTTDPGTSDPEPSAPTGGVLKIGVLSPTTGSEAYYGTDMLRSYQLAVDEINAAGGVLGYTFELFQEDDGCDAAMAATAASKIISNEPDFVVGGYCSGATIPALQQFIDDQKIMLVSCANSTNITALNFEQTFMINSPGTHAALTLAELCEMLGVTKAAMIHQGDDYTKNLSDICSQTLPENGIEITTVQVMEKGAADVSAIVTAVRNSGAEMVYWCGYHADGSNVIKQLRQGGYTGYICCGDGSSSPELIEACGTAGEGVYVTSPPFVEFAEGGQEYVDKFAAKYGEEPGTYSTLCYDTIYMLKAAIETSGGTDYATVRDAIQNIEYQGLSGLIKFADNRELAESNFIILQIEGDHFILIEP